MILLMTTAHKTAAIMKRIALAIAALLAASAVKAEIKVPDQFGDNMVLQQNSECSIWGWASEGARIAVSFNGKTYRASAGSDGRWDVKVSTPAASYKTYQIKLKGDGSELVFNDVLVGEVWFAGGQSNMDLQFNGLLNCPIEGAEEVLSERPMRNEIRMIKIDRAKAMEPQNFMASSKWQGAAPETIIDMSAVCYFFARKLQSFLDVPIGIIDCSHGGTRIESWLPFDIVAGYGTESVDYDTFSKEWAYDFLYPSMMYNAMFCPVKGYTVRGFIWYQGCSNLGHDDVFVSRMVDLVNHWRHEFGDNEDKLPFYMTEVAPYCRDEDDSDSASARLRQAQHDAAKAVPNSGCIVTDDLVYPYERYQIHPCQKRQVGERLAYYALNRDYGFKGVACDSPEAVRAFKKEGLDGEIYVNFVNMSGGVSRMAGVEGLEVCGTDMVWHPVTTIEFDFENNMKVKSAEVPDPVEVRYCWGDFVPGNLKACNGLPVAPFRFKAE